MFRRILFLIFLLTYTVRSIYGQDNHFLSDIEFFQVLNLDYPGLETVQGYVEKGNYSAAKRSFVEHIKSRTNPKWFFDWRDYSPLDDKIKKSSYALYYADRHVNNELYAHNSWYKYGDTIDWTADHSNDHYDEWVFQLNRHYCWLYLAEAYWATGNEQYAKAFVRQLNSWIDQCKVPERNWNRVGSVWRSLDAGLRVQKNWPDAFFRFLQSSSFDDETIIKMIKSFYNHAIHLRNHSTSHNWLAVEMNGLYVIGGLFPEFKEAEDWRSFAVSKLYEQELEMFYPDGAQVELAPFYHSLSVSSIVAVYRFARLNGYNLPEEFVNRLENAYDCFVKLRMPDGKMPSINDSQWIDSKDFLSEADDLFPERKDFVFFATEGTEGTVPSYTSTWMPWAGWYVMRSGWEKDAFYAFFEVGPYGAGHQHEDKLSFILYAYGQRLITECGYYSYDQSVWRKYSLSSRGHNVSSVDGKEQNRRGVTDREKLTNSKNNGGIRYSTDPLPNIWVSKKEYDIGEGFYADGFGEESDSTVTHHRTLKFVKNKYWIVNDEFTPSDTLNHTYDTWFHLNTPSYRVNTTLGAVYSDANNTANIAIIELSGQSTVKVVCGQEKPEIRGWKAVPGGGNDYHCEPVATPTYSVSGKGVIKQSYLFIPFQANQTMSINKIRQLSKKKYRVYLNNGERFTVRVQ